MGCTGELNYFKHSSVIECYLWHKSVHEIPALLDLSQSTVSAVMGKWKHLGATTAQPQSGSKYKLRVLLKCVQIAYPLSYHLLQSSKLPPEATSAQKLFVRTFMNWVSTHAAAHKLKSYIYKHIIDRHINKFILIVVH